MTEEENKTTEVKSESKPADISEQLEQVRRDAMNVKTKQIYTMIDAEMESLGFEKNEGEKTIDAYKRLIQEFRSLKEAPKEVTPGPEEVKIQDSEKEVYEAKIKELSDTLGSRNKELENRLAELQRIQLRQKVSSSFDSSKIAVPSNLSEESAIKYRESIKNTIVSELERLDRKVSEGKEYIYIDGKPQIDPSTLEPKTESQLAKELFSHFFITEKHPNKDQLDVMNESQKQAVIKNMNVKSLDDAKKLASNEFKRNSPQWAKRVNEIMKAHGIK